MDYSAAIKQNMALHPDVESAQIAKQSQEIVEQSQENKSESQSAQTSSPSDISAADLARLGREVAVVRHLQDGEEYSIPLLDLIKHGQILFSANWTVEEGAGRPLTKGNGLGLIGDEPLTFPRNMNRVSGPDANSCAGCHNMPFGIAGGGGDFVANVFVTAQRFDFVTFDRNDDVPTQGAVDENGKPLTLQNIGSSRATIGMFGEGYIEMLARQMTVDLQAIRDQVGPNQSLALSSKGVSFGVLSRDGEGNWDVSKVMGLPTSSITSTAPTAPPTLIVNPFHQAGGSVSLRNFTNNAFNQHHGIQSTERFGINVDKDGDGVVNEMTRADVTAATIFQATMAVPGRVIPNDPVVEKAIWVGEQKFEAIGCAACHVPALPLDNQGWVFVEPNPFNTADDLRPSEAPELRVDLTDPTLPQPRLQPKDGIVWVPAYTDLKLHNISSGPDDPTCESINMNARLKTPQFFKGNCRFLTTKLWGAANQPPYFHHGLFTTLREATLAHNGEALTSRQAFEGLSEYEQASVIEFLKSLQVLPPGTQSLVVDENGQPKQWPPQ
ncbi:MAG: di-heme oxidoredictase family protein [Caldilineaceae bacterium]